MTFNNNLLLGAAGQSGGGFDVPNAIHFDKSASQAFSRALGSAGDQRTLVASFIVRRGSLGGTQLIFAAGDGTNYAELYWNSSNRIQCHDYTGATRNYDLQTTAYYRDVGSVYLVQLALDTTNSSVALWVNGEAVTSYVTNVQPSLNFQGKFNSNVTHYIGRNSGGNYLDGNLSECVFLDGSADPTGLFEIADNGEWRAIDPTTVVGAAGAKSFYITDATGADQVNSNDFTPVNTPTDTADTPSTVYPIWNVLDKDDGITSITNGALTVVTGGSNGSIRATIPLPAMKTYWIVYSDAINGGGTQAAGIMPASQPPTNNMSDIGKLGYAIDCSNSNRKFTNGTASAYGTYTQANGAYYMFAFDQPNGKLWVGFNGTWLASGDPATDTNPTFTGISTSTEYLIAVSDNNVSGTFTLNCGATTLPTAAPTGYVALNSANIYANDPPAIEDGSAHFQIALHTGTGSALTINQTGNITFTPDFVWSKGRSGATDHILSNVISGTGKYLKSNSTAAEVTDAQALTAFGDGSISYGTLAAANTSSATYVDWMWKGGGAGVSNTSGSTTSTVSANTTAGQSIVKYTGTGANATVGHGLPSDPDFIIVKQFSAAGNNWPCYHSAMAATEYIYFNSYTAKVTGATRWNSTAPSGGVFSLGSVDETNQVSTDFIAYCFAEIPDYSKFGSYTGNGSTTDGPFVYLGFKPAFLLVKCSSSTSDWWIWDAVRDPYNLVDRDLYPNLPTTEDGSLSSNGPDFLSNGFKFQSSGVTGNEPNQNGVTYIYAAFASVPSFGPTPAKAR